MTLAELLQEQIGNPVGDLAGRLGDRAANYAGSLMAQKPQEPTEDQLAALTQQYIARDRDPNDLPPNLSALIAPRMRRILQRGSEHIIGGTSFHQ